MVIIDLHRLPIEVIDIDDALQQAEEMVAYCPATSAKTEFEKRQLAYWQDLQEKLQELKTKINGRSKRAKRVQ